MSGKVNLYGLGDHGIDLVSTPIHQPPNSWRQLQNAEFSNIQGQGGVKKRGALTRLNTVALNGGASIQALFNIPLATTVFDHLAGTLLYPLLSGFADTGSYWRASTSPTAASFVKVPALNTPIGIGTSADLGVTSARLAVSIGTTVYFIDAFNDVYSWDGAALTKSIPLAAFPQINGSDVTNPVALATDGVTLFIVAVNAAVDTAVFSWTAGPPTLLADFFTAAVSGAPVSLVFGLSKLWLLMSGIDTGIHVTPTIFRLHVGDLTWTSDFVFTGYKVYGLGVSPLGNLLVGTSATDGNYASAGPGKIWRTTAPGAWANVFTSAVNANAFGFIQFLATSHGGVGIKKDLFAVYTNEGAAALIYLSTDDGVTWGVDFDLVANFGAMSGVVAAAGVDYNNNLPVFPFVSLFSDATGFLVVRTGAGVWEQRDTSKAVAGSAVIQGAT